VTQHETETTSAAAALQQQLTGLKAGQKQIPSNAQMDKNRENGRGTLNDMSLMYADRR